MSENAKSISFYKFLKVFLAVLAVLAVFASGAAVAAYLRYKNVKKQDLPITVFSAPAWSVDEAALGEKVTVKTVISSPWDKKPEKVWVEPGKGMQLLSEGEFSRKTKPSGTVLWTIETEMQGVMPGESGKGTLSVTASDGRTLSVEIPPLNVKDAEVTGDEPVLAPPIGENVKHVNVPALVIGIIIVSAIVFGVTSFILRMKKRASSRTEPPWKTALDAIVLLRKRTDAGLIRTELSIAELTDVVRKYLEQRFSLKVRRQTTDEFLSDLDSPASPLQTEHRTFLRSFMTSADMVKFAGLPAGKKLFSDAADEAEMLITNTKPPEEKQKGGGRAGK